MNKDVDKLIRYMLANAGPPARCGYCDFRYLGMRCFNPKCLSGREKVPDNYDEWSPDLENDRSIDFRMPEVSNEQDIPPEESNLDFDERLIVAIGRRTDLCNSSKLHEKERTSKQKREELWLEVTNSLGCTDVYSVKKRWQYLRFWFVQEKDRQQQMRRLNHSESYTPFNKLSRQSYEGMKYLFDEAPSLILRNIRRRVKRPQSSKDNDYFSLLPDSHISCSPGPPSAASSSTFTLIDAIAVRQNPLPLPSPPPRTPAPGEKKRKLDDTESDEFCL